MPDRVQNLDFVIRARDEASANVRKAATEIQSAARADYQNSMGRMKDFYRAQEAESQKLRPKPNRTRMEQDVRDEMAARVRTMREEAHRTRVSEEAATRLFGAPQKPDGKPTGLGQELKDMFGKGAGRGMQELAYGGQAAVAAMVGAELNKWATKLVEIRDEYRGVKATTSEIAVNIGKSLPIFGQFVEAGQQIRDLFTDERHEIEQITASAKLLNSVTEYRRDLLKQSIAYQREYRQMQRGMLGEAMTAQYGGGQWGAMMGQAFGGAQQRLAAKEAFEQQRLDAREAGRKAKEANDEHFRKVEEESQHWWQDSDNDDKRRVQNQAQQARDAINKGTAKRLAEIDEREKGQQEAAAIMTRLRLQLMTAQGVAGVAQVIEGGRAFGGRALREKEAADQEVRKMQREAAQAAMKQLEAVQGMKGELAEIKEALKAMGVGIF